MQTARKIILLSYLLWTGFYGMSQQWEWDADAGLIAPFHTDVIVSSGNNKNFITDGNAGSYWQSDNPLPYRWIQQLGMNVTLNPANYRTAPKGSYQAAFDGNTDTKADITRGYLEVTLNKRYPVKLLSVKLSGADTVFLDSYREGVITGTIQISPQKNYQLLSFNIPDTIDQLILRSTQPFSLFELSLLNTLPYEYVIFDFGTEKTLGWIAGRWLNENIEAISVYYSDNGKTWRYLKHLNPKAIALTQIPLTHPVVARFLKILFTLPVENYRKARLWEMAFYDRYGPYGKPPAPQPSNLTWQETFGINTVWGWGYSVYSDRLPKGTGPQLFIKAAKQLRTYHRLDWDLRHPQQSVDFNRMDHIGTPANSWLNWDREYGYWKKLGFGIDAAIMFNNATFPDSLWKNTIDEGYAYGNAFARHFINNKQLISMVEVGNEPWEYSKNTYRNILKGMAQGIAESTQEVTVLPCAVQAYDKYGNLNDYIANYLTPEAMPFLMGLNTHIYNYVFNEAGKRVALPPEDPRAAVWSINNLKKFIKENQLYGDIYVTEFGYDSDGGGESCTHSECVSETQQAAYGIRTAMILWRLGVKKMYWYFFANVNYDSFMHNRSGLTASYANKFAPKKSFFAFQKLLTLIGPYRFEKVIMENKKVYAYLLKNPQTGKQTVIAWRPTYKNMNEFQTITLPISQKPASITPLIGSGAYRFVVSNGTIQFMLSGIPVVLQF